GRIWAESLAQSGSTFIVDLPLTAAAIPERPHGQENASRLLQTALPLVPSTPAEQRLHVLLAEDSLESQELMQFYFRDTPYQVEIVSDGERAVVAFQTNRFDIVLIDLQMPGMDGFTATRLIRAWESAHQRPPTPILALTANAFREAEEQSLAAGCTGFLTKPITRSQLLDALNTYHLSMPPPDPELQKFGMSPDVADRIAREIQQRRPQFLEHRRKDLGAMRQAAARQDYEAIRTMGHRIKGVAGSYGFPDIGTVGQRLEQSARARDLAAIHREIEQLAAILVQLDQAA
ncbi:MAG: response regulator, partial [Nitrospira defluvii]|nr:response regulator [Nitrospira defluvii]